MGIEFKILANVVEARDIDVVAEAFVAAKRARIAAELELRRNTIGVCDLKIPPGYSGANLWHRQRFVGYVPVTGEPHLPVDLPAGATPISPPIPRAASTA